MNKYFYDVYVYERDKVTEEASAVFDRVATFTSLKIAQEFVELNDTDINEGCYDIAKIFKFCYGDHYSLPEEIYVYNFDYTELKYKFVGKESVYHESGN